MSQEWNTQDVSLLPKISLKERILRWQDILKVYLSDNARFLARSALVITVGVVVAASISTLGYKAWMKINPPANQIVIPAADPPSIMKKKAAPTPTVKTRKAIPRKQQETDQFWRSK